MGLQFVAFNHLTIASPKKLKPQMKDFYERIMGFREIEHPHSLNSQYDVIWYDRAGFRVHIDYRDTIQKVGLERHFAIQIKDLKGARAFFMQEGVPIREDVEVPYCDRFDIMDPAGNYIEVLELKKPAVSNSV